MVKFALSLCLARRKNPLQADVRESRCRREAPSIPMRCMSYMGLSQEYEHKVIDHAERYVDGRFTPTDLKTSGACLSAGLKGTYVNVEPFHLFRYLDEQSFRYNNRATKNIP